jgi:LmbE family N-acetylglucosaminyl deacetylase
MAEPPAAVRQWGARLVAWYKPRARSAWRQSIVRRATDVTQWSAGRSAVVVAPHPDDESIGCGATIARKRAAGADVHVVVVCDGRSSHPHSQYVTPDEVAALRAREVVAACGRLGVAPSAVTLLGHRDGEIDDVEQVSKQIGELIDELQPDELYLPSPLDWHPDHRTANLAGRAAAEARRTPPRLLEYPVWFWAEGPWPSPSGGTLARAVQLALEPWRSARRLRAEIVSTTGFVGAKRAALREHRTQTRNLTGEASWATLPPEWFDPFLAQLEMFFPVPHVTVPGGWQPHKRVGVAGRAPAIRDHTPAVDRVSDRFLDDRPAGTVMGSVGPNGALRLGRDAERSMQVDHGALRIRMLETPGWGREGIAYGPVTRRPGRAFAALVLNGHNTSQTDTRPEGRKAKAMRLAREAPQLRLKPERTVFLDNLAVGWFPEEAPHDPRRGSHAFVMHAATVLNGELRVMSDGRTMPVHRGVQNVPIYYVAVLRSRGAIYYAASVEGAAGVGGYPELRPVGIDPRPLGVVDLYPGIHQCVLGEVGYRVDTRVYGVEVADIDELSSWCTSAILADTLLGEGLLQDTGAERGGQWRVLNGSLTRTPAGLATDDRGAAAAKLDMPLGLLHVELHTGETPGDFGIVLRADEQGQGFSFTVGPQGAQIAGASPDPRWRLRPNAQHAVQVLDDRRQIGLYLDGELVSSQWYDAPAGGGDHVVIELDAGDTTARNLEVHPRTVPLPEALDVGRPWLPDTSVERLRDDFNAGEVDLADTPTSGGRRRWERTLGEGRFLRQPKGGVRVDATVEQPCPGRTLYTVEWDEPTFAELAIEAVPPGRGRGEGHAGRGGVVFWQDAENHLVINPWLDDDPGHDGSSVSAFLRARGREDMYEAVWANVGREVHWGAPYRLRVAFDGQQFLAWINDQPVLYRRITDIDPAAERLAIRRVGIATNWEWGDDTGTLFRGFAASARGASTRSDGSSAS